MIYDSLKSKIFKVLHVQSTVNQIHSMQQSEGHRFTEVLHKQDDNAFCGKERRSPNRV